MQTGHAIDRKITRKTILIPTESLGYIRQVPIQGNGILRVGNSGPREEWLNEPVMVPRPVADGRMSGRQGPSRKDRGSAYGNFLYQETPGHSRPGRQRHHGPVSH